MKNLCRFLTSFSLIFFPSVAFASKTVEGLVNIVGGIINSLAPLIVSVAVLVFLYALARYIFKAGDATSQTEARNLMIWGIVFLFVMLSLWGFVRVLQTTFKPSIGGSPAQPLKIDGTNFPIQFK